MKYLLLGAVFLLVVSVGMSLDFERLWTNWRRFGWSAWLRLLVATFLIPPAVVLVLARVLPLEMTELVGLFMVSAAPGAPLLTRNISRRGFDRHMAATYQVWGACLTPLMIPLIVAAAGRLYGRDIWIPPRLLLTQIVEKEFVPLLAGMALMYFVPALSRKLEPIFNKAGNAILTIVMIVILVQMGPAFKELSWWLPFAALVLAMTSMAAIWFLLANDRVARRTLAISNANRHVGLALLLAGQFTRAKHALPSLACYALVVAVLMFIYPKFLPETEKATS